MKIINKKINNFNRSIHLIILKKYLIKKKIKD